MLVSVWYATGMQVPGQWIFTAVCSATSEVFTYIIFISAYIYIYLRNSLYVKVNYVLCRICALWSCYNAWWSHTLHNASGFRV